MGLLSMVPRSIRSDLRGRIDRAGGRGSVPGEGAGQKSRRGDSSNQGRQRKSTGSFPGIRSRRKFSVGTRDPHCMSSERTGERNCCRGRRRQKQSLVLFEKSSPTYSEHPRQLDRRQRLDYIEKLAYGVRGIISNERKDSLTKDWPSSKGSTHVRIGN